MDADRLTSPAFWADSEPVAAGGFDGPVPAIDGLEHHVLFETSGTAGVPRWIALSKNALRASAAAVNRHLGVTDRDCWGLALPLRHVGGFGVAARAFDAGCRLECFSRRWDAGAFACWLDDARVTLTSLVPTQVHDLIRAGLRAPSGLRAVVVGGGRLDETAGRAARVLGWPVLASYGMTEAASQIATQPPDAIHDIYQPVPIPLLPVWRAELSADGLLEIAGPALFSGVLVKEDGAWTFSPRVGEWHRTRDRVLLEGALLTPAGRADLMVKVLGELVDPEEIERALIGRTGGALGPGCCVVVALPDERAGHALVPVFDAAADRDAVRAALAAHESSAAGPWRLGRPVFLTDFPRGALGKPRRMEVAALVAAGDRRPA